MESVPLSPILTDLIFQREVSQGEIDALKQRCESYQGENFPSWTDDVFFPYSQYFGFLAALKIRQVLEEAKKYGYLSENHYRIVDMGAGTLGATLGVLDFFRAHSLRVDSLTAVDKDLQPVKWASHHFKDFLEITPHTSDYFPEINKTEPSLIIFSDMLSENHLQSKSWSSLQGSRFGRDLVRMMRSLSPSSLIAIVEPAHKKANQHLLSFRDLAATEMSILLPCPHAEPCPALRQNEWCHEERQVEAPIRFTQLVHKLGFARRFLQYSQLVLGKQKSAFGPQYARVVSRQLKSKGRCDKWLCQAGQRFKVSEILRKKDERNAPYFDSLRGDVLDSTSTPLPQAVK